MQVLIYIASAMTVLWGIAHLAATGSVVRGFGQITADNRKTITMEWMVEGVALVSIGVLVAGVTLADGTGSVASTAYAVSVGTLVTLSVVSLFTGFRVAYLPFRLCPVILGLSAVLIALGAWV
jgi:hypothetical protein